MLIYLQRHIVQTQIQELTERTGIRKYHKGFSSRVRSLDRSVRALGHKFASARCSPGDFRIYGPQKKVGL